MELELEEFRKIVKNESLYKTIVDIDNEIEVKEKYNKNKTLICNKRVITCRN